MQVADHRKLGHGFQDDRQVQIIQQSGTGLPDPAVDHHGAGPANLFQAVAFPDHGGRFFPVSGYRILLNLLKAGNHVGVVFVRDVEFLPVGLGIRLVLPFNFQLDGFYVHVGHSYFLGLGVTMDLLISS